MEKQLLARLTKTEKRIVDLYRKLSSGGGLQTLANILMQGQRTGGKNIIVDDADAIELNNTSLLKKGTNNFGGDGGISRVCSIGFEDNWQSGFRHVFDNNGFIRHSTNCFDVVPNSSFDVTKKFKVNSLWTLDSGTTYICNDPAEGEAIWSLYSFPIATHREIKLLFDTDGDYTFEAGDQNKTLVLIVTSTEPVVLSYTIPENVFSLGEQLMLRILGTSNTTIKYFASRTTGNTRQYSADESLAIITLFDNSSPGQHYWAFNYISSLPNAVIANDFLNDSAAASGNIPVGGQYHTAGVVKIRLT